MNTEIYYFSGTGNSLFIAKELQKRVQDCSLIPIVSLVKRDIIETHAKTVGFVFPVHALTIPIVVRKFVRKLDLRNTEYAFAVANRGGTVFRGFSTIDRMLRRKGKRLDAQFILEMYSNDARHGKYKVPTDADIRALERKALTQLDVVSEVVNQKAVRRNADHCYTIQTASNPIMAWLIERIVLFSMVVAEHTGGVNYFHRDSNCNGCGACSRVCLSGKIAMVDNRPVWRRDVFCYMCFACLNFCPKRAVQIHSIPGVKSLSVENGRYPHPYASVSDIAAQKQGNAPVSGPSQSVNTR